MKITHITAAAGILLGAMISPAVADPGDTSTYFPQTSNDLLALIEDCEDDSCMSYVSGAIGGIAVYTIISENPSPFCTKGDVETDEIRRAIISTIKTTPEIGDQHPAVAILTAFGRNWPCITTASEQLPHQTFAQEIAPDDIQELIDSNRYSVIYGNLSAGPERTILVFHDPNCDHCKKFRDETKKLAENGWKVVIYPIATTIEESADHGAVEIALKDVSPAAVMAIYESNPETVSDVISATEAALATGLTNREILMAMAKSNAYQTIEENTRTFFEMNGKGAPSWIVGNDLYGGFLTADGIEKIFSSNEEAVAAPSSKEQPSEPLEQ